MTRSARILVVADEVTARTSMVDSLRTEGYEVETASDAAGARAARHTFLPHVVVVDFEMRGDTDLELVQALRISEEPPAVIVVTGAEGTSAAVRAMRAGAADFLTQPLHLDALALVIERVLERATLERDNRLLRARLRDRVAPNNIIGSTSGMLRVFTAVDQLAPHKTNVLLSGEPGTGKDLLANALHMRSPRSTGAFTKLHGALITHALLTSLTTGSTLFVTDVAEMSAAQQVTLLTFLERNEIDVRVIASSAVNIANEVQAGRFDAALFARLAAATIDVAPLRDRKNDIASLAKFFVDRTAKDQNKRIDRIAPTAMAALVAYDWPGNVRELENVLDQAATLATGTSIESHHLPSTVRPTVSSGMPLIPGSRLEDLERYAILETLKLTNGSTSKAAEMLGISVRTIQYRLQEYNTISRAQQHQDDPTISAGASAAK